MTTHKNTPDKKESVLDENGSIKATYLGTSAPESPMIEMYKRMYGVGSGRGMFDWMETPKITKNESVNESIDSFEIDEVSVLYLLEVLLHDKKQKRYKIISEIKAMGVII